MFTSQNANAMELQVRKSRYLELYVKPAAAELIGTFSFVFIGAGSAVANTMTHNSIGIVGVAIAHGLALAIMITIFMATSGGHINPAVTAGFIATNRISPAKGLLYIVAQLIGATLAALALRVIFPPAVWQAAKLGTPSLAPGIVFGVGVFTEMILTFFLVLAVFGTIVDKRSTNIGGFGVGLIVLVGILMAASITGPAINPARAFGPALAGGFWQDQLVYWIGPIIGGVIAAVVYDTLILRSPNGNNEKQSNNNVPNNVADTPKA